MEKRTTILDGEDTEPLDVNSDDEKRAPASKEERPGERSKDELMQDEADTDGSV